MNRSAFLFLLLASCSSAKPAIPPPHAEHPVLGGWVNTPIGGMMTVRPYTPPVPAQKPPDPAFQEVYQAIDQLKSVARHK